MPFQSVIRRGQRFQEGLNAMLNSLPAESRPARGDGQDVPATRLPSAPPDKFPPAIRLMLFVAGAAASWGVIVAVVWLVRRAL